jgi:AcrR family transcriptional regulator
MIQRNTGKQSMVARSVGRPSDTDSEDTKQEILNAAEQLFADQGFAATTIRQIAEKVGVNTAMVHYYFGKKPQLLQAVFERVLEPLAVSIAAFKPDRSATLADFAAMFIAMASLHPNLPRLVTREVLLPGGQMRDVFIEEFAHRLGGALPGIVATQQKAKKISQEFDPATVTMFTLSLCIFPFIAQDLASEVLKLDFGQEGVAHLSKQVGQFINRGLSP